jgi:hypothetical protein
MLSISSPLFAYGPVPGVEFLPYFLALFGWIVLAIFGVLFSPVTSLIRRLASRKAVPTADGQLDQDANSATAVPRDDNSSAS